MIGTLSKTVAVVATPERISSTTLRVGWATVQAKTTNSTSVFLRAPNADSDSGYEIVNPGDSVVLWSPANLSTAIDLNHIWLKVGTINDGVNITYVK